MAGKIRIRLKAFDHAVIDQTAADIDNGKIKNYQQVVPSTWNLGPADAKGQKGPVENALIGTPVADPKKPLEILRTVHSFDPCIACAVHVIDPHSYPFGDEYAELDAARLIRRARDSAQREMGKIATRAKVRFSFQVIKGSPAAEISVAANKDVDLIVTSTHGRTGLSHALIGSVAERVVRYATCPVLVVPVRPGRNMTTIVEVAARNHLLKLQGHHSAREFQERLNRAIALAPGGRIGEMDVE